MDTIRRSWWSCTARLLLSFLALALSKAVATEPPSDDLAKPEPVLVQPDPESDASPLIESDEDDKPTQGERATRPLRPAMIEDLYSSNLRVLYERCALIFVGTVKETRVQHPRRNGILHTAYVFEIDECYKGNPDTQTVTITNSGGEDPELGLAMGSAFSFRLKMGEVYLVFLRSDYKTKVLPIIRVFAVVDGGATIVDEKGRRINNLSQDGDIFYQRQALYPRLYYGRLDDAAIVNRPLRQTPPKDASPNSISLLPHNGNSGDSVPQSDTGFSLNDIKQFFEESIVSEEDDQ